MDSTTLLAVLGIVGTLLGTAIGAGACSAPPGSRAAGKAEVACGQGFGDGYRDEGRS